MNLDTPRIGIMICTANRPQMLIECIKSLIAQEVDPSCTVEICVVENDLTPLSKQSIMDISSSSRFPIHYAQEVRRGIPFARNKTLQEGLDRKYDLIALLDDDEKVSANWLMTHLQTLRKFNADVSYGPILRTFDATPPDWWDTSVPAPKPEGAELNRASTGNVFFKAALAKDPVALRFNEKLTFGYEDLDFFERAVSAGFKIVWSPNAIATEHVPASRLEPSRLLAWARSSSAAHAQIGIIRNGFARSFLKFSIKGIRRIIGGTLGAWVLFPFAAPENTKIHNRYYKLRMRTARGIGNLQGLGSRPFKHYYDTIDDFDSSNES
ncbi:MAG: glycosyltransferase family 2 protein [Rhodobacteraceae bacterium]|nr:glycosyltransferase family 2 protein [Paracoccaceae bacterium]